MQDSGGVARLGGTERGCNMLEVWLGRLGGAKRGGYINIRCWGVARKIGRGIIL